MSQLTDWFDGKTTVPGQPGVYERAPYRTAMPEFAFWNGNRWYVSRYTVDSAAVARTVTLFQDKDWRGLREPANG